MVDFTRISVQQAAEMLESGKAHLADIRDEGSFARGHVPNTMNVGNHNLAKFLDKVEDDHSILVLCYHGVSSQGAAQYIAEQGFDQVYSVDGGFEGWATIFPDRVERG